MLRACNTATECVDCIALCLTGIAQDKQVLPRQERNGNEFDQFFTLGNRGIYIGHNSQHFIS